jgi:Fe-S-cluster containining protein
MSSEERLGQLVAQLDSDERYAVGARRFPGYVTADDAVAIAEALADELDAGCATRAELAAAEGLKIACSAGCHHCCTIVVLAYRPEVLRIVRWLEQPENAASRDRFVAAYPKWRAQVGDAVDQLPQLFRAGKKAAFESLHMELWRKGALCAFNHDGLCSIYPVRPLGCRNAHALDTAERCVPDPPGGQPPSAVSFLPLEEFLQRATRMLRATHNAISTQRHHQEALCSAVRRGLGPSGSLAPPRK